nr:hypothetical protein [Desulforamulus aquiferis]
MLYRKVYLGMTSSLWYSIVVVSAEIEVSPVTLKLEELKESMFQTRLEIFELMYQLKISSSEQERRDITARIRALQRLHYWQFRQVKTMEEQST